MVFKNAMKALAELATLVLFGLVMWLVIMITPDQMSGEYDRAFQDGVEKGVL